MSELVNVGPLWASFEISGQNQNFDISEDLMASNWAQKIVSNWAQKMSSARD